MRSTAIRSYGLFGETANLPDPLHIEAIATRSALHDWELAPHRHQRLHQVLLITSGGGVAHLDGERVPLRDISVDGFAITAEAPPAAGEAFAFELHREGVPDRIRGRAQSVNFIASVSQAGCRFLALEGDGSDRLRDWLVALVIMNASVRISEKDAATIVAGPSLI